MQLYIYINNDITIFTVSFRNTFYLLYIPLILNKLIYLSKFPKRKMSPRWCNITTFIAMPFDHLRQSQFFAGQNFSTFCSTLTVHSFCFKFHILRDWKDFIYCNSPFFASHLHFHYDFSDFY